MRRGLVFVLLSFLSACGSGAPTSPPAASETSAPSVATLEAAPTSVMFGTATGGSLSLVAILEDTAPLGASAPTDGATAIDGTIVVFPFYYGAQPSALRATRAWLIRGNTLIQLSSFSGRSDATDYSIDFANGPSWGPGSSVDVVVELTDGTTTQLLRGAAQGVSAIYTGAGGLSSTPSAASLAGTTLTLSPFVGFSYCGDYPPPARSFSTEITVKTADGAPVPSGVSVSQVWILLGDKAWTSSAFSVGGAPARTVTVLGSSPPWGTAHVDVIAALTDGTSIVLVRAGGMQIFANYMC